jgi:DNA repair protein RadC
LVAIPGIGEQTAILVKVVAQLASKARDQAQPVPEAAEQPALFEVEPELGPLFDSTPEPKEPPMRTFANDEIANSLAFIPQAAQFETFEAFKAYLRERLPYNSESTRERRANYILNRFFPEERLDVPLTYYVAHCTSKEDLKPALFYHVLKSEPLAVKVAEEFVWPALPIGRVDREDLREFILRYLPDIGTSSQQNVLRSLFTTYELLSVGVQEDTTLRFQVHTGTLKGFLYVLTAEFPKPGIYTFEALEGGPMRLWLLWDREWMRRQLYNLRDLGVIAKVSEIDTVRQFTLAFDQWGALRHYFEHPERDTLAMREQPPT